MDMGKNNEFDWDCLIGTFYLIVNNLDDTFMNKIVLMEVCDRLNKSPILSDKDRDIIFSFFEEIS
ncbi:hypothetical protein [Allocoleopsis sp.]|uniref:hypothetical protein n=1 Tax=Allocoleopsis sp. TaxID=3088169 RepID=UPI002FD5EF94